MKKFMITVIIMMVAFALVAEENLMEKFSTYQKEQTSENFQAAVDYYEGILQKDESNNSARTFLVYLYMMKMNQTMEYFAENTEDLDMKTKFGYANILLELGQFEQATKVYNSLNEAAPKWSCPWRHKGEAQFKSGKMEEAEQALKVYNSLNEAAPKWSCPWRHKGEAQFKSGKMEEAEQAFLKAIETRKEHYDAYVWLAKVQKAMGKYKDALKSLETGLSYKGKDIEDAEKEVATSEVDKLHEELKELAK